MPRNLETRMEARDIVGEAGMSARPEFYSGRGAIACDLNDRILERVYQGIKKEHGESAATNFAQMVADIPKLSATDFLNTLYRLEGHDWKWGKGLLGNERGVDLGPDYGDGRREEIAEATVIHGLFGDGSRNETDYIRREFLKRHGI